MRLVAVSERAVGMKLARTLYNEYGDPLLKEGTLLTERYIELLAARGIPGIYVVDPYSEGMQMRDDVLSEQTRQEATQAAREIFLQFEGREDLPVLKIRNVVQSIIQDVMSAKGTSSGLALLRDYDIFTFTHSVNVCTYSIILGMALELQEGDLIDLGVGALLHDIGKIRFPGDLIAKSAEAMSDEEMQLYQQHPIDGYNIMRASPDISLLSAHVSLQHHEHWDGSGFPRRSSGEGIHLYGRIAAVVDYFDNLCSRREGQAPLPEHIAAAATLKAAGRRFEPSLVSTFFKWVALYPAGTIVCLSNGLFGMVSRAVKNQPLRPDVRIIADRDKKVVEPYVISLVDQAEVTIKQVLTEYPEDILMQLKHEEGEEVS